MNIHFKTIPHKDHRYETVGDYFQETDTVEFRVSEMNNSDYEFLVFIHELIEWYLTLKAGIPEPLITDFDEDFEKLRKAYPNIIGDQEPGHMVSAPYHKQHVFAESIERLVAVKLGIDWDEYERTIDSL